MFEDYEIDYKMSVVWLTAFVVAAILLYSFVGFSDRGETALDLILSDESPEAGQEIEITVFEDGRQVEASILRVNDQAYRNISNIVYQVPNTDPIQIYVQRGGEEVNRTVQVSELEPHGNQGNQGSDSGNESPGNQESGNQGSSEDGDSDQEAQNDSGADEESIDQSDGDDSNQETDQGSSNDQGDETNSDPASGLELIGPEDQASFEGIETVNLEFELDESSNYFVRLNGERVAQGSGSGLFQEEVSAGSGTHTWFVRAVHEQQVFDSEQREFTVIEPVSISIDDNSTEVRDGYILDLGFEVENAQSYRVLVNDQSVSEGSTGFSEFIRHKFESSGSQEVAIQALRAGEVVREVSRSFESSGPPEAQVNWLSPQSFDTTTPETEFEILSPVKYDFVYTINEVADATEYNYWESNDVSSSTESHSYSPDPLPQGNHDYRLEVRDEHSTQIGLLEGTFETTEGRSLLEINSLGYRYVSEEDLHMAEIDLKAYEEIGYSVYLNGTETVNGSITGTNVQLNEDFGDITSGEYYEATVNFDSTETFKTRQENFSFEAQ